MEVGEVADLGQMDQPQDQGQEEESGGEAESGREDTQAGTEKAGHLTEARGSFY